MLVEAFRHCYSKLPEATLLVSSNGRIIEANNAAKSLLDKVATLPGALLSDIVTDSPEKVARLLELSRRSRDLFPGALTFKEKTGELACKIQTALFSASPEEHMLLFRVFPKVEALERFRTLNERIDALNREVVERKRAESRLFAQQELLRATLASIGDGAIATDVHGRINFMNGVAQTITGWSQKDAAGKPLEEVFIISNETTGAAVENPVNKVLREGEVIGLANHTNLAARDGRKIPIDDSAAPILDSEGKLCGVVLVFRDVTSRRESERVLESSLEALRAREQELTRANEDLSQFAFAASHDLQEPLRMISSYSQLLVSGYQGDLSGEAALCVKFITEGTHRMRELLADLLAYTQVNGSHDAVESASVDLGRVFSITLQNCKTAIEEADAIVTSDPLPTVSGYEPHFIQLMQNLIGNSLKYRSSEQPRIHVSAKREGREWKLGVSDNGIGIEPEYHHSIFGVFKRLHGKEIPGTGIGLAICQRVVMRYGGRIWVQSMPNEGTTIYWTLPVEKGGPAA
jgi:PAS domain S-box-containing protein